MVRRSQRLLPLAAMETLLRRAGAVRVGEDAKAALKRALERHGKAIAASAATFARHAGRRTVMKEDVLLALERQEE
jgi:histone H3/H4